MKNAYSPVFLARSIVSFTDHLPSSSTRSSSAFVGRASSSAAKSSNPPPFRLELLALSTFLASARLDAMASLILTGVFGIGGSSWGRGLRKDLAGVGVDFVRTRRAGEAMLGEGFNGDAARERGVGGTSTFGFDGLRDILSRDSAAGTFKLQYSHIT
jgi:hypothetical protein